MSNIDVMFSSTTDLWATPQDFFDKLDAEFHFTLDPCALLSNAKCNKFYTPDDNGLLQDWGGRSSSVTLRMVRPFAIGYLSVGTRRRSLILRW